MQYLSYTTWHDKNLNNLNNIRIRVMLFILKTSLYNIFLLFTSFFTIYDINILTRILSINRSLTWNE